jgi:hypothetical protein
MRLLLAGLYLLIMPALAFAQAKGEVESVGFNNAYRPDSWTPMVVRLHPDTNEAGTYLIQVWQHDLDGDRPIYSRQITLNGSDQARDQRFWMYFLPQPIDKGLADPVSGGTLKDLQRDLQVFLCTTGGKQIAQLPITSTLMNVDPFRGDYSGQPRGAKLILSVSDGTSQPLWRDYSAALGVMEDVEVVSLQPRDLPENPLGYEAVDAIVWFDSDPADLDKGGEHKLAALQDYVRFGGQLVICQPTADWQKVLGFSDLLPVVVQGVAEKKDLEPLRSMAYPNEPDPIKRSVDSWNRPVGPFQFARATAKPGSVVESSIDWKGDGSDLTPYLVRAAYGLGQVTWVAHDLGNSAITSTATAGWPYVWDKVFGWKNDTYVIPPSVSKDDEALRPIADTYRAGSPVDLGFPLVQGLNLDSKGAWLIFVAVAFFVIYWIVAGPASFLYLAQKKRAGFSWFFFGLAAVVATAVTVLVVKIVLRGPPEIRHLSIVRIAPNQPAIVYSRFGLYIPRDGDQSIRLNDALHQSVSYISSFAENPNQLGADVTEFPSPADYLVPVRDLDSVDPAEITVPYRSSLKKFQTRWIGELPDRITGSLKLDPKNGRVPLTGTLTNQTAKNLSEVYLAFHVTGDKDWMIYLPNWASGQTLDMKDLGKALYVGSDDNGKNTLNASPGQSKILSDEVSPAAARNDRDFHGWLNYWYSPLRKGNSLAGANVDTPLGTVFPMLSLFDRIPPSRNIPEDPSKVTGGTTDRFELYRRGARMLNVSPSIMAGQLAILATAQGTLPVPVEIDGDVIGGTGTILYQFLLPIDRGDADRPTTQQ